MPHCPTCNRTYPDDAPAFCPHDATPLVNDDAASNPQPPTQGLPSGSALPQVAPQRRGTRRKLPIVIGSIILLAAIAAGLYFLLRPQPPAGTFPAQAGPYKLTGRPVRMSSLHFDVEPSASWHGYYKRDLGSQSLVKGVEDTIDLNYDVFVFSSPDQAKQGLESFVKQEVAGRQFGMSAKIAQQGNRPKKPGETFAVLDLYDTGNRSDTDNSGQPKFYGTRAVWTDGTMLIVAYSTPNNDPRIIRLAKEQGLNEEAAIDFMKNYPS